MAETMENESNKYEAATLYEENQESKVIQGVDVGTKNIDKNFWDRLNRYCDKANSKNFREEKEFVSNISKEALSYEIDDESELKKHDFHGINKRDDTYVEYLKAYSYNYKVRAKAQSRMKWVFFSIVIFTFILIIVSGFLIVIHLFMKSEFGVKEIATLITSIVGMVSAFIALPEIIARNLFPANEIDETSKIFLQMANNDLQLRRFYRQGKSPRSLNSPLEDKNVFKNTNDLH